MIIKNKNFPNHNNSINIQNGSMLRHLESYPIKEFIVELLTISSLKESPFENFS